MSTADPRKMLAIGILGTLLVAFTGRALWGVPPLLGRQVNQALDALSVHPLPKSAELLEQIARDRPRDSAAWVRAGRARVALGDAHAAAELLEVAVQQESASSTARYELAKALSFGWMNVEAEEVLAAMLERRPGHADGLFLFSALAAARGDADAAAERFSLAVSAGASDPERFREDPRFDPVRGDPRFVHAVREARIPDAFEESP